MSDNSARTQYSGWMSSEIFKDYMRGASTAVELLPERTGYMWHASDQLALYSDWLAVYGDLRRSFSRIPELKGEQPLIAK